MGIPVSPESELAKALPLHAEATAHVDASPAELFAHLDDHVRLASHMEKPSWQMGGGSMRVETDAGRGRVLGSHIVLSGRAFGLAIYLDEVVIEREVPRRKVWETVGTPQLIVVGPYRMCFEITDARRGSTLRVFIDYALPQRRLPFALALAGGYARWCTRRMVADAVRHFAQRSGG